jgi:hypothetical protein
MKTKPDGSKIRSERPLYLLDLQRRECAAAWPAGVGKTHLAVALGRKIPTPRLLFDSD